ncbi:MAG: hypothetical protein K2X99_01615 [Gemmatimonadaceae bacterium]|nr:hypothetical protein [Gemmatimonadaceae bacterium]
MTALLIGVDGGGSKTRVVVTDEHGTELSSATGGPSAVRPGQAVESADVIATLARQALLAGDHEGSPVKAICVGVAGVGREPEREALRRALVNEAIAEEVIVEPDALVALEDAFGDGAGVLLVCGTGSVAFGRSPAGQFERCGGWGPVCGDEGSGQWIGRRALSVITASHDGREPMTSLEGAVLTSLQLEHAEELIAWAADATNAQFAQLATPVMAVAATGDLRANSLLAMAAEELVLHVRTLARALFMDERAAVPLALTGGLMARGTLLRQLVERRLKSAVPGGTIRPDEVKPARGAVRLARRLLGVA